MFFPQLLVLSAIVLYSQALITPHLARPHHHRAIAPRVAASFADPSPLEPRRLSKRCKPRPSHSHSSAADQPSSPKTTAPSPPPATSTTPTTTYTPPTHSTQDAHSSSPTYGSGGNVHLPSFLIGMQTGQGTYYGTGLGACGITNTDTDYIAAVSHLLFDAFPGYNGINSNTNPVCGRKLKVYYQGKSVTVTITDRCVGCALTDLDMSPTAFQGLADKSLGRLFGMHWYWV